MHDDVDYVRSAFEAGASGYLLKRSAVDELEQAIKVVWAGNTYITPLIAKDLIETFLGRGPTPSRPKKPLTFRQREVLQLLAEGRAVKEIAVRLKISTRTVEFHKAHAMEQLGLRTTAQLIKYALTHGILSAS